MAELQVAELSKDLQAAIAGLEKTEGLTSSGVVIRVGDGVAWIHGLKEAGYSEVPQGTDTHHHQPPRPAVGQPDLRYAPVSAAST